MRILLRNEVACAGLSILIAIALGTFHSDYSYSDISEGIIVRSEEKININSPSSLAFVQDDLRTWLRVGGGR